MNATISSYSFIRALKGTLKDFGIAEILQLIGQQAKTGVLHLESRDDVIHIALADGSVVRAESAGRKARERLGTMLVRADLISKEELQYALDLQKKSLRRLGDSLVEQEFVSKDDLREMTALQTTETIFRLFHWKSGTYEFEPGDVEWDRETVTPLRAESVLMEGFRQVDEWPLVRKKISSTAMTLGKSWAERREIGQLGLRMADALEGMRAVTIAQVHGYAVGGGLVLAAVCDLRVAAEDTVFSIPEVELGIPLAWGGIPRLVREIGPALTKELVMTCRLFTPDEAKAAGFLNRVVPRSQLAAEVESLAARLLEMPSVPVTITKEHVNSVTHAMGAGSTAFADGDALLSAVFDPESLEAGKKYIARTVKRKKR